MKARAALRFIATSTLLFKATSGNAQHTPSAKSFVEQVYADYSNADWQHEGKRQARFYTRSLNRMIVADAKRYPGEVGHLDFDPICDCQDPGDPGELKVQTIKLTAVAATRMKATVSFNINTQQCTVTLSLLRTGAGWRIDDTSSHRTRSLRELLKKPAQP